MGTSLELVTRARPGSIERARTGASFVNQAKTWRNSRNQRVFSPVNCARFERARARSLLRSSASSSLLVSALACYQEFDVSTIEPSGGL